jgi:hypothetical protein
MTGVLPWKDFIRAFRPPLLRAAQGDSALDLGGVGGDTDHAPCAVAAEALAALLGARPADVEEQEDWRGLCEGMVRMCVSGLSTGSPASSLPLRALCVHLFAGGDKEVVAEEEEWLWRVSLEALSEAAAGGWRNTRALDLAYLVVSSHACAEHRLGAAQGVAWRSDGVGMSFLLLILFFFKARCGAQMALVCLIGCFCSFFESAAWRSDGVSMSCHGIHFNTPYFDFV